MTNSVPEQMGQGQVGGLVYQGHAIRDDGEMLCLTDMWKSHGSDPAKKPAEWLRSAQAEEFIAFVGESKEVEISHLLMAIQHPGDFADLMSATLSVGAKIPLIEARDAAMRADGAAAERARIARDLRLEAAGYPDTLDATRLYEIADSIEGHATHRSPK